MKARQTCICWPGFSRQRFFLATNEQPVLSVDDSPASLTCLSGRASTHVHPGTWETPRHFGRSAAARAYYLQALEAAGKIRFRPELALTHLRLAECCEPRSQMRPASWSSRHLDVAIPELRDMRMQPALERALALSEKQAPAKVVADGTPHQSVSDTLTAREREIARLIAGRVEQP